MIQTIPTDVAPAGMEGVYKNIWNYYLWGFSVEDIHSTLQASGETTSRQQVRDAIASMKAKLDSLPYQELSENEFRLYLARNYQTEQELIELYIQARNDVALLRSGQTKHPDGSRPMSVDIKTLMSILSAIEKQGQARASILSKLANPESDNRLTSGHADEASLLESFTRRPQLEDSDDIIDVEIK